MTPDPLSAIPGWTDFERFYDRVVAQAPPGSTLVEVGVFVGRSLAHLARAARDAKKGLKVVGVDWFRGDADTSRQSPVPPMGNYAGECLANLQQFGLADDVVIVMADSLKAADLFATHSLHMVFLDGAHDYRAVLKDIGAWGPKVKPGGILAGHDIDYKAVVTAVDRAFGGRWHKAPDAERVWELTM